MLNKKLAAFSLIEMLVVMLLSSIVLSAAYYTFYKSNMYYSLFNNKQKRVLNIASFNTQLRKDLERCNMASRVNNRIVLKGGDREVNYISLNNLLIREQGLIRDTLEGKVIKFVTKLKWKKMEDGLLDEIFIEFVADESVHTIHQRKRYSSEDLIHNSRFGRWQ